MSYQDQIMFLPVRLPGEFEGGSFIPVNDFDEINEELQMISNPDGFLYPPYQKTIRYSFDDDNTKTEEDISSSRAALVYRLPASHILEITTPLLGELRKEDGAFLMHLVGYLYGYRLQFHDWWLDGRVPLKQSVHRIVITKSVAEQFISQAYARWKKWNTPSRQSFINILYMHSRAICYEWNWESFIIEFMVFDALYNHAHQSLNIKAKTHAKRIEAMCGSLGLWFDLTTADEIVTLRNELFHESLWHGNQPSSSFSQHAYYHLQYLRNLNQRLIPAILGFTGEYTKSAWINWKFSHVFQ